MRLVCLSEPPMNSKKSLSRKVGFRCFLINQWNFKQKGHQIRDPRGRLPPDTPSSFSVRCFSEVQFRFSFKVTIQCTLMLVTDQFVAFFSSHIISSPIHFVARSISRTILRRTQFVAIFSCRRFISPEERCRRWHRLITIIKNRMSKLQSLQIRNVFTTTWY